MCPQTVQAQAFSRCVGRPWFGWPDFGYARDIYGSHVVSVYLPRNFRDVSEHSLIVLLGGEEDKNTQKQCVSVYLFCSRYLVHFGLVREIILEGRGGLT